MAQTLVVNFFEKTVLLRIQRHFLGKHITKRLLHVSLLLVATRMAWHAHCR
jgi:hypothetical protein